MRNIKKIEQGSYSSGIKKIVRLTDTISYFSDKVNHSQRLSKHYPASHSEDGTTDNFVDNLTL